MNRWFQRITYSLQQFMYGRYGTDLLSRHLSVTAMALLILSLFVPWLYFPALAVMLWSTFRTLSRNVYKRQRECAAYERFRQKLRRRGRLLKNRWRDRKTHRFYKCPGCKEYLRVPKGGGEVHITCPGCHHTIVRKT